MPATNIRASLHYSGEWHHAPSYERSEVLSTWGVPDEGAGLTPAECHIQLDNRPQDGEAVGRYAPDDARGELYGLIGLNTPGRVALLPGLGSGELADTADTFTRTSVDSWGSTESGGQAWGVTGFGSVLASDFQVTGGFGTHSVPSANTMRLSYLGDVAVRDVEVAVTFKVAQATGDNLEPANIMLRTDSDFGSIIARVQVVPTTNAVEVVVFPREGLALGEATVAGLTHAGTGTPLRVRVLAIGSRIHMRVWDPAGAEPDEWHLIVTDDTEPPQTGFIAVRSGRAVGNTNVGSVTFSYDNWESTTYLPVADGAVTSWLPDRAVSDPDQPTDAWTDITVNGPAARVNASKTVKSALRSTVDSRTRAGTGPAAYWPMEGYQEQPSTVASAVPGVPDASHDIQSSTVASPFDWPGDSTLPGSQNLPVLESARTSIAGVTAPGISISPDPALGFSFWARTFIPESTVAHGLLTQTIATYRIGSGPATYSVTLTQFPPGSAGATVPADGEVQLRTNYSADGSTITQTVNITALPYVDAWRHVRVLLSTSGSDISVSLRIDGEVVGSGTFTALTLSEITRANFYAFQQDTVAEESVRMSLGHHTIISASVTDINDLASDMGEAGLGYPGETTSDRFVRLLAENGIVGAVHGDDPHTMGAQRPDTLPNLINECARTDLGLAYDGRAWNGVELRTGRSLRNQTAALALTFGVNLHHPIRPATDDLGRANEVTATSRTGASAVAEQLSGPNNVNDPIDDPEGITRVQGSTDVNPASDSELRNIAGWGRHVGTFPGARYKNVTVHLSKHPELLPAVMALRPGDLITIDELDADQVELLVLGAAHTLRSYEHVVTFNCAPAGPYRTPELDTDGFMRIGSSSSSLAADFNAGTDTSMSVAFTGRRWSTTAPPFHVRVGGVVLNVTAVAGTTSPQTFTVDATPVNGIERLILASGPVALTRVDVEHPVHIGA